MLRAMRKPFDADRIRLADRALKSAGIADCHTFILGTHGESVSEAGETLRFVDSLDPSVAVFMVYMEDREAKPNAAGAAPDSERRSALLRLLADEAPKRPTWVVPELQLRFDHDLMTVLHRRGWAGPSWLFLAQRHARSAARATAG